MAHGVRYPVADPADWAAIGRLSPLRRLALALRERRYRRRAPPAADAAGAGLTPAGPVRPLAAGDLALVCVLRNVAAYLDAFLDHYRRLGVTRFVLVDDRSTDGTAERLAAQGDVDLFTAAASFAEGGRGLAWRDALFTLYGRGRWYLNVDADEFLVFPGSETRRIPDLIADLERAGRKRCLAPMLDLYPTGALRDADPSGGRHPLEVSPMIDGDGYEIRAEKFTLAVRGGPRTRLFGNAIRLTKFPLILVDEATSLAGGSIHGPLPIARNFAPVNAVLLHFKFSAASVEEFPRLAREGQHFGGSMFYRQISEADGFGADLSLAYPGSLRVGDTQDLVRRGFMQDPRAP
ncbi:glycosyltransferase family 2 protein [Aureimonas flava]|uniref:Glycosyltransferase family 2 protein n=1 Tax=Aureimonas flava TaxID=2320271 RepID=A0A3A1WJH3_9HYPH|nr:glycosyltransferase family 2 protein [Aureimonas flava]RIX99174.1 glycosyltransferase family 2 protein [Aureimonas flava]